MTRTILVVDDDPLIRQYVDLFLAQAGLVVLHAGSATEGLTLLERTRVDLVLLDFMLPDMAGSQALEILRQRRFDTPIMMLTARNDVATIRGCLEAGASAYLVKPVKAHDLVERVLATLNAAAKPAEPPSERVTFI